MPAQSRRGKKLHEGYKVQIASFEKKRGGTGPSEQSFPLKTGDSNLEYFLTPVSKSASLNHEQGRGNNCEQAEYFLMIFCLISKANKPSAYSKLGVGGESGRGSVFAISFSSFWSL